MRGAAALSVAAHSFFDVRESVYGGGVGVPRDSHFTSRTDLHWDNLIPSLTDELTRSHNPATIYDTAKWTKIYRPAPSKQSLSYLGNARRERED